MIRYVVVITIMIMQAATHSMISIPSSKLKWIQLAENSKINTIPAMVQTINSATLMESLTTISKRTNYLYMWL
jgi:hypothetical protein